MNQEQVEGLRTLTVLRDELATRTGPLLKVTAYPWGVEFDLVRKEGPE